LFDSVERAVRSFAAKGYAFEHWSRFCGAKESLQQALSSLRKHWRIDEAMWQRTEASMKAGALETVEDVLHELQGDR
jgi:hypothetical protein